MPSSLRILAQVFPGMDWFGCGHGSSPVIIGDFYLHRTSVSPDEAHSPLVVDADAELAYHGITDLLPYFHSLDLSPEALWTERSTARRITGSSPTRVTLPDALVTAV